MEYTYSELKEKNLTDLKKLASGIEHEAVKGYTQLNKEHLIKKLCEALGIDTHEHHQVVGINKKAIKSSIKKLKLIKAQALLDKDKVKFKKTVNSINILKKKLRKATV
jgi:rubrerythrin